MNKNQKKSLNFSRRDFLGTMAATAAFTIVPRSVLGGSGYTPPSDMVNIAGIGVGARGASNIRGFATPDEPIQSRTLGVQTRFSYPYAGIQPPPRTSTAGGGGAANQPPPSYKHANIYALCDVDLDFSAHVMAGYPKAKRYQDYREMLDKEKEIDAVMIATPDHTHAIIASAAMKAGKHVYVEKPMTKTIYEARYLRDLAIKTGLVTQVGNQGHNAWGTIQAVEWIRSGVIGNISEVHMWSNRPIWKQGWNERPAGVPVPANLNYDVWLGPAPDKPYHPDVVHFNWRGLWDYGTGAMGDMGAHTFDCPVWALDLGYPTKIQATSTAFNDVYLPQGETVTYEFPARGNLPPVKVTWSDGGLKPARPAQLEQNRQLLECLYIGDKGMLMHRPSDGSRDGSAPFLIPDREYSTPEILPRPKDIYQDFIDAIKEGRKSSNSFEEYGSRVCEIMLLTNVAVAAQRLNITLEYDAENMRVTNCPEANDYLHYEYRKGWSL